MPSANDDFVEPTSIEDAEERRCELIINIQEIQTQLGDKQRTDEQGARLDKRDYWEWKSKAQFALNKRLSALRLLKAWIHKNRQDIPLPDSIAHRRSFQHLETLCSLLEEMVDEEVEMDEDELEQIKAAREFLRRN